MRKLIISTFAAAIAASSVLSVPSLAVADEHSHHHHNNTGAAIAGGVAAGVIGGLLAGSAANYGPRYAYQQRCWFENRPVQNNYDDGWHYERVRVCG
jgi:hypothetical protein